MFQYSFKIAVGNFHTKIKIVSNKLTQNYFFLHSV